MGKPYIKAISVLVNLTCNFWFSNAFVCRWFYEIYKELNDSSEINSVDPLITGEPTNRTRSAGSVRKNYKYLAHDCNEYYT